MTLSAKIVEGPKPSSIDGMIEAEKRGYGKLQAAAFERGVTYALMGIKPQPNEGGRFATQFLAGFA
jgi:hypothetical protein